MIEEVLLTSICRPKQWKTISTKELKDSGYPVYGANGKIGFYNSYTHETPTILITCRGATCGTINICEEKSYVNGNAMALDNLSKDVDMYFLKHFLEFRKLDDVISGSAQPQITGQGLSKIKIPLPPLATQQKIAAILDAADELRKKDKALVAKYDELTQALFLDMFGDPVTNPKGWEILKIENILSTKSQNGHYALKEEYLDSGVQMIHMSDAFYQKVIPGNLKRVKCDEKLLSKFLLKSSDLLLSRRSLTYEGAAKPCFIPDYDEPLIYESSLIKLSPNLELINSIFLFYFLSNPSARIKYVLKHVTKSTISGINNKGLNAIELYVPPIKLQNQFSERVKAIEEQKSIAQASALKSEELFNSLLQKAFNGELV
jgi:type I restriction enzyme S subunit